MRNLFLFFVITLLFTSCKKDPFFSNFDRIEYYHLRSDSLLNEIPNDLVWQKVINEDYPLTLNDTLFYKKLSAEYFNEKSFSKKDVETFKEIFNSSTFTDIYTTACIPDYRDVLILKKSDKIVGIVKICLGCEMNYIIGKDQNNKTIKNSGGLEKKELEMLLKKYK